MAESHEDGHVSRLIEGVFHVYRGGVEDCSAASVEDSCDIGSETEVERNNTVNEKLTEAKKL